MPAIQCQRLLCDGALLCSRHSRHKPQHLLLPNSHTVFGKISAHMYAHWDAAALTIPVLDFQTTCALHSMTALQFLCWKNVATFSDGDTVKVCSYHVVCCIALHCSATAVPSVVLCFLTFCKTCVNLCSMLQRKWHNMPCGTEMQCTAFGVNKHLGMAMKGCKLFPVMLWNTA